MNSRNFMLFATAALFPVAVHAQEVGAAAQAPARGADAPADGLGDIVVTAQKRSENLQDVPISVAAVSGDDLRTKGVTAVTDLQLAVPSMVVSNANGVTTTMLRGLGSTAINPGYENPTAFYVDGVYIAAQIANALNLGNTEQLEVLKGPQGTLFGRNATAGLMQVKTRTPGQRLVAEGRLSYGNYDTLEGTAYLGGPLSDKVSADISFYGTRRDGWGRNITRNSDSYGVDHNISLRSKWVFDLADTTRATFIADYNSSRDQSTSAATLPGTINPFYRSAGYAQDIGYDTRNDALDQRKGTSGGVSLKIEQELGSVSLMSLTAYRKSKFTQDFDYDYGPARLAEVNYTEHDDQFSQELQLQSDGSGKLQWTLGGYYFNATADYDPFHLKLYAAGNLITIHNFQKTESIAGFAQATYELTDNTRLTFGGRYTYELRKAYDGTTSVYLTATDVTLPTISAPDRKASFDKFTFRLSLDHRFSDEILGYVSFNRGFKSGGFNTGSPGSDPYLPESVDAYEVGLKSDLADRRLRLNLAGYYYDYTNIQAQRLAAGVIQVTNAAAARIYGVEADFQALVTPAFTLSGGLNLVSSKYRSYPGALFSNIDGYPSVAGSAAGNYLALAAKFTGTIAANYRHEMDRGAIDLNANLYYNSGYYLEADNETRQPDHALLGASVTWTSEDSRFSVGLFGRNLTNNRVLARSSTVASSGLHVALYGPPRTYGITAGFKF